MTSFKIKHLFIISSLYLFLNVFNAGCSSVLEQGSNVVKQKSFANKKTPSYSIAKNLKHKHKANICYEELTHTHENNIEGHQHSHGCLDIDKDEKVIRNAHIHPASKKAPRIRHVHPNGAIKHSHHR